MTLWAGVRTGARGVTWYLKGLLGEDAYEKYVAHHAASCETDAGGLGCAPHPLLTEREFWKTR